MLVNDPKLCHTDYCDGRMCEYCDNHVKDVFTVTENALKQVVFSNIDYAVAEAKKAKAAENADK